MEEKNLIHFTRIFGKISLRAQKFGCLSSPPNISLLMLSIFTSKDLYLSLDSKTIMNTLKRIYPYPFHFWGYEVAKSMPVYLFLKNFLKS
jgi:hypothetical protein